MTRPKLIFFGSSHTKRLVSSAKALNLQSRFEILDYAYPGARIRDLFVPNFKLFSEQDIIVIQVFGNSTFHKNIKVTKNGNQKVIHLTKYSPRPIAELESEYEYLLEILQNVKCKIFLIDNIFRHIKCCELHYNKNIFPYQKRVNVGMKKYFSKFEKITFIEHLKLMGLPRRTLKTPSSYATLLPDSVHFKPEIYRTMTQNLISILDH